MANMATLGLIASLFLFGFWVWDCLLDNQTIKEARDDSQPDPAPDPRVRPSKIIHSRRGRN
jgi:hypothetical protein